VGKPEANSPICDLKAVTKVECSGATVSVLNRLNPGSASEETTVTRPGLPGVERTSEPRKLEISADWIMSGRSTEELTASTETGRTLEVVVEIAVVDEASLEVEFMDVDGLRVEQVLSQSKT
jgi:hypothetical protein